MSGAAAAPSLARLAVLDDFQDVARAMGPWDRLPAALRVKFFHDHLADHDALAARLAPYDALVVMRERTPLPRALLARLPKLRLLVTTGARNRSIDLAACAERGVTVCGTPSVGHPTVDLTWGLILALARGIPAQERDLRAGRWQAAAPGIGLEGRTLGVVGLGNLGARVARVGAAFGMRVLAWSANLTEAAAAAAGAQRVPKEALLAESDVVTLHLVLSDRSRGIIAAPDLARMKPTALLVNTSRGPLVDGDALVAALHERRIAGAGIDVYDTEPLPPDHPLLAAPNTVLTPHLGYVTQENYRAYFDGAVECILAYLAGSPLRELRGD